MNRTGPKTGKRQTLGVMSDDRVAWCELPYVTVLIFEGPDEQGNVEANGDDPIKMVLRSGSKSTFIHLSSWTVKELEALREIVNMAIDRALPTAKALDEMAKEALDAGDDSFTRVHRIFPKVHVRERKAKQHGEGVHDGPSDAEAVAPD